MNIGINSGTAKVYNKTKFLAEVLYELQFSIDAQTGLTSITGAIEVLRGERLFALDSILRLQIEDGCTFEVTVDWKDEWSARYYVRGGETQDKSRNSHLNAAAQSSAESAGNASH